MSDDKREAIYHGLHRGLLSQKEEATRQSALKVLGMLGEYFVPNSMLDVGCGLGVWIKVGLETGMKDVLGMEGPWVENSTLAAPSELILRVDLEKPISVGRRFDLVVCSEVAEHLSPAAAAGFIDSLVAHGDHILFSAAIPFQQGLHHVNEQFLDYWVSHFARHDFVLLDLFRARLWDDRSILWWLRQNLVLFVKRSAAEANAALREEMKVRRPVSIVHPGLYAARLQELGKSIGEHARLIEQIREGGRFEVKKMEGGGFQVTRLPPIRVDLGGPSTS
jgi:hypothetical protein